MCSTFHEVVLRITQVDLDLKKSVEDQVKQRVEGILSDTNKLKSERAELEQKATRTTKEMQKVSVTLPRI